MKDNISIIILSAPFCDICGKDCKHGKKIARITCLTDNQDVDNPVYVKRIKTQLDICNSCALYLSHLTEK